MNIAIAQSGGPTCAINASLVGVFRQALLTEEIDAVFGSINGIEGMISDELINLKSIIRTNEDMELLRQTPSTMLGSCRYKLPAYDTEPEIYVRILNTLTIHRIGVFLYIGGNDSMDTVVKLSKFLQDKGSDIRVIGVPKTIDNDLPITDHTPGFGSAVKYVAATVQEIIRDSSVYSIPSVTIVEIMGRHSGWLAASSCILRANGEEAPPHLPAGGIVLRRPLYRGCAPADGKAQGGRGRRVGGHCSRGYGTGRIPVRGNGCVRTQISFRCGEVSGASGR